MLSGVHIRCVVLKVARARAPRHLFSFIARKDECLCVRVCQVNTRMPDDRDSPENSEGGGDAAAAAAALLLRPQLLLHPVAPPDPFYMPDSPAAERGWTVLLPGEGGGGESARCRAALPRAASDAQRGFFLGAMHVSTAFEGTRVPDDVLRQLGTDAITLAEVPGRGAVCFVRVASDELEQHALDARQLALVGHARDVDREDVRVGDQTFNKLRPFYLDSAAWPARAAGAENLARVAAAARAAGWAVTWIESRYVRRRNHGRSSGASEMFSHAPLSARAATASARTAAAARLAREASAASATARGAGNGAGSGGAMFNAELFAVEVARARADGFELVGAPVENWAAAAAELGALFGAGW